MTHICVDNLTIIGSDNGLSPVRRQAIIWTNAGILLIGPLGTNFCEIVIGIQTFSFKKMRLKVSFAKWRLFCLGLNELMDRCGRHHVILVHAITAPDLLISTADGLLPMNTAWLFWLDCRVPNYFDVICLITPDRSSLASTSPQHPFNRTVTASYFDSTVYELLCIDMFQYSRLLRYWLLL